MFNVDNEYELPRDVVGSECLVQLTGRCEVIVENYKCVKTITDIEIEVMCRKYTIVIRGSSLFIKYYNSQSMIIGGCVDGISFV